MRPDPRLGWMSLAIALAAVSWSSLFVRFADVGPITSAFWRMALAVPFFLVWARYLPESARALDQGRLRITSTVVVAAVLIATDLVFFHVSLMRTSVANASFISATAAIFATIGSVVAFREPIGLRVLGALVVALVGVFVMGGARGLELSEGDLFALAAAVAYGGYIIAIKAAARDIGTGAAMLHSTWIAAALLVVPAIWAEEQLFPATPEGWLPLLGLAFVSQSLGQGLNTVALRNLPVAIVSVVSLAQPAVTAVLAALLLGESVSVTQAVGAAMILAAVFSVRPGR